MTALRTFATLPLYLLGLALANVTHAELINGTDWVLNLEYRQLTADNPPFSRRVYVCNTSIPGNCEDSAAWDAQSPAPGWEVADARVRLFDTGAGVLPVPPAGVPGVIDFNGYSMNYTADVLTGSIIDFAGPFVLASVERDTVLTYNAGSVIHEVFDPDGNSYVMFTAEVSVASAFDLTMEDSLAGLALPAGWSYASRTLTTTLNAATGGTAAVFVAPGTSWQRYSVATVPVLGSVWLVLSALAGVACVRCRGGSV